MSVIPLIRHFPEKINISLTLNNAISPFYQQNTMLQLISFYI